MMQASSTRWVEICDDNVFLGAKLGTVKIRSHYLFGTAHAMKHSNTHRDGKNCDQ